MAKNGSLLGTREFEAALEKAQAGLLEGAQAATDAGAESMADDMRGLAPMDTGELVDGIQVVENEDGTRDVGTVDVEHAPFVEFGTEDTPAQPFATPAAEVERQRFEGRVADEVKARLPR